MRAIKAKKVHVRKLAAIMEVKSRTLLSRNFIIMPVFSIGFTFLMNLIYSKVTPGIGGMNAFALAVGILMNISMTGLYCVSAALAEEKEKNTLRTLMTSSVNGLEFFLGSLIPAVIMTEMVNVVCVFIVRFEMDPLQWGQYVAVTSAAAVISSIVGMIFGIFARNQVSASTITTPGILIFMMIPMFSGLSGKLEMISGYLFTGITYNAIANIYEEKSAVSLNGVLVMAGEAAVFLAVFLLLYRKNGFER